MTNDEIRAATFTVVAEIRPDETLDDFLARWNSAFRQASGDTPYSVEVSGQAYPTPFVMPIREVIETVEAQ